MAVRMRLTRVGSKKNPVYRVVVADSRSPSSDRSGQRHLGSTGQPPALGPQADAEDDEADEERQNAGAPAGAPTTSAATTEEIDGCTDEVDPSRVEEEPGLPGGRGRLAFPELRSQRAAAPRFNRSTTGSRPASRCRR